MATLYTSRNEIPTRAKCAARLRWLSINMIEVAGLMMRLKDPEAERHAAEMIGAAREMSDWARELEED